MSEGIHIPEETTNHDPNKPKTWRDKIPTFIAVTTLILAVCATSTSFKAAGFGYKMVLSQNQSSDQWAYYQAKSIKQTTYQIQRDALEIARAQNPQQAEQYNKLIAEYSKEIARYKQEQSEIMAEAKMLEKERDKAQRINSLFGQGLILLEVGILLSSLAAINKIYGFWYLGSSVGAAGVIMFFYTLAQTF
jgi:hypothetical protein